MRSLPSSTCNCTHGGSGWKDRSNLRKRWSRFSRWCWLPVLAMSSAFATEQEVRLQTNQPAKLTLPWPVNEADLEEPRGYNHHGGQQWHLARTLTIENTGTRALERVAVVVNGHDWSDIEGLIRSAELPASPSDFARALFTFWTANRSHASCGLKAAEDPLQMLRSWGYTICGEDTQGIGRILAARGIAGRSVPLNGHVAGEYL